MIKIYALTDPRSGAIRYIGKTKKTIDQRLINHIQDAKRSSSRCWRSNWIRSLLKEGVQPNIILLEECEDSVWESREKYHIENGRKLGWRLTNMTKGGEGNRGLVMNLEARLKISRALIGRPKSEETIANMKKAQMNKSDEVKRKISQTLKGHPVSEATREKLRIKSTGKIASAETRKKISERLKGHGTSEETRAKIGNKHRGKYISPETRKKQSESRKGIPAKNRLLTDQQVAEIRRKAEKGEKQADLGREYQVSKHVIHKIVKGKNYPQVNDKVIND